MTEIVYWITETEKIVITDQMTPGEVASKQSEYWAAIARQSVRERGGIFLPRERVRLEKSREAKNRFKEKAYLRFR